MTNKPFDDIQALILLKAFYDNFLMEWDKYKDLAMIYPDSLEIIQYFDRLFPYGFQKYSLLQGTELYRARIIKSCDSKSIGIEKNKLIKKYTLLFCHKMKLMESK